MKVIPCPRCGREARGPASPEFPAGAPVVFGRWSGGAGPLVVKCFSCKQAFKLDVLAFNRIPEASADELRTLGIPG